MTSVIPFMAVVGKREIEQNTVAVRVRGAKQKQEIMSVDALEERLLKQIRERSLRLDGSG